MASHEVRGEKFRAHQPTREYVRIDWDEDSEVSLDDAHEALEAIATLAGGRPTPVLVDMRGMRSIRREARKNFAETDISSRTALYVESALSRTVANFFIGVARPDVPSRVFTDLEDARRWLLNDGE